MFNTFIVSIPSMSSIGGLLLLLIFMYAVVGVYLFAPVKIVPPFDSI